jgi:lipopolysaccharide transport system permease protein
MTIVFTVFFGDSISLKTKLNIPYPIFALSGMLLWTLFSSGMSNAANSMVSNSNIIKKIYFPRLIIPISSILVALVDFFISLIVFVAALFFYKVDINYAHLLYLPISVITTCMAAMGIGMLLAALNIKYRDVRYVLPFLVQGMLFLTPVLYPDNISNNEIVQSVLKMNPISGALDLIRSIFIGYELNLETQLLSFLSSLILFIIGIIYFRKTENYFADLA